MDRNVHSVVIGLVALALVFFIVLIPSQSEVLDSGEKTDSTLPQVDPRQKTYLLKDQGEGQAFSNYVDGYELVIPQGIAPSFDAFQARTRFHLGPGQTLDIYATPHIPYGGSGAYYLSLVSGQETDAPNPFSNTTDHHILEQKEGAVGDFPSVTTRWDRTPLNIPGDQAHYYAVDLETGEASAVSFLFKSSEAIDEATIALVDGIAESFRPIPSRYKPVVLVDTASRPQSAYSPHTQTVYEKYFSDEAPLRWGIFSPEYSNHHYRFLLDLEADLGTTFKSVVHYMDVTRADPQEDIYPVLKQAYAEGRSVELTIQTINPPEGPNQVYEILNGAYDSYFADLASYIEKSQATILLRIGNEMNGDWCMYSPVHLSRDPDLYVAFYRYLVDFFEAQGVADQMLYVWNPNGESFPAYRWNDPVLTWPGGEYVDIVGLTAYNNGTYYSHESWRDFDSLYQPIYESYQDLYAKPFMITEFASADQGGDKVAWVEDMLSKIDRDYPKIKMAIWWDHKDYDPADLQTVSRNYAIDEPQELKEVFRAYFEDHHKE